MERFVLTDAQWAKMEPHCLGKPTDPGRSGSDNRRFVEAVLWIVRTGSPWRDLPPLFGNWNTVFKRYRDWVKADVFTRLFEMLWGGGEPIIADVTNGGPNAKAERPEPIPYRPETGQHTDRGDRNEFVELARCRHRAWRRASAVEEACSRRERIAEAAQSLA